MRSLREMEGGKGGPRSRYEMSFRFDIDTKKVVGPHCQEFVRLSTGENFRNGMEIGKWIKLRTSAEKNTEKTHSENLAERSINS